MHIALILRKSLRFNADHIEALRCLGLELHLLTETASASLDGRFRTVTVLEPGTALAIALSTAIDLARREEAALAITFAETDIVLTAAVNQALGVAWCRPDADAIARDKSRQRRLLDDAGLPSVSHVAVGDADAAVAAARRIGFPVIVKPTMGASSKAVVLVDNEEGVREQFAAISALAATREGNYFTGSETQVAMVEEFLPGLEVTLDGVVLFGRFYLAGISNKKQMPGPYFEEQYYTLPFRHPELEPELEEIARSITKALELEHSLFNAELRRARDGSFRVVEFSTRMSGGQNYRNLRDVFGIDVVRLFAKAVCTGDEEQTWSGELHRLAPRRAACLTYVYRTGRVVRNGPGDAYNSPHFLDYIPVAEIGERIARAPRGFDVAGSLSVAAQYRDAGDIDRVAAIASDLDNQLDLILEDN